MSECQQIIEAVNLFFWMVGGEVRGDGLKCAERVDLKPASDLFEVTVCHYCEFPSLLLTNTSAATSPLLCWNINQFQNVLHYSRYFSSTYLFYYFLLFYCIVYSLRHLPVPEISACQQQAFFSLQLAVSVNIARSLTHETVNRSPHSLLFKGPKWTESL